jgi:hypothetical protein
MGTFHVEMFLKTLSIFIPLMLVSNYQQRVSIALQCAQAITILQWVATLGQGFSSCPHIIVSAFLSLIDLWQMTTFLF